MLYTELTKKAMKIAFEAHKNQLDKSGMPYIYHPIHLAEQMEDEQTICIALLHDVVEDAGITFDQLSAAGFSDEIIAALRLLTHDGAVPYMDYVKQIKTNPLAAAVKLADLRHNSDLARLNAVDEKAIQRAEKYRQAICLLTDDTEMSFNRLIPELTVSDIHRTKQFYIETLGFRLEYERPEDKFIFVSFEGSQLMFEELHEDGWNVAEMTHPFGRGINFSIEADDIDSLYEKLLAKQYPLYRAMTVSQYEANGVCLEQKEFLVQDPDGYLLRFTQE